MKNMDKKVLHWSHLRGNPYLQPINPLMLLDEGYLVEKAYRVASDEEKELYTIAYTKDFVIQSLIKTFLEPLEGIDKEFIEALLLEALNFYFKAKEIPLPSFVKEKDRYIYLWDVYQKKYADDSHEHEQI